MTAGLDRVALGNPIEPTVSELAERLTDALYEVDSPVEVLDIAAKLLGEHLRGDSAGFAVVDPFGERVAVRYGWVNGRSQASPLVQQRTAGSRVPDPLRQGRTIVVSDVSACNVAGVVEAAAAFGQFGSQAFLAVAVLRDDALVGLVFAASKRARSWSAGDQAAIELVAQRTRQALVWMHLEEVLREREQRQAFLLALSDAIRPIADPVEVETVAARLLGEHLLVDRSHFFEYDQDKGSGQVRREYHRRGESVPRGPIVYPRTAAIQMLLDGHPVVIRDTRSSELLSAAERERMTEFEIRSSIAVPLVKHGRLIGTWTVACSSPRDWTDSEVSLVTETVDRIWADLERARAEQALRESEALARTLIANLPGSAVTVIDRQMRYVLAEGELLQGVDVRSYVGQRAGFIASPDETASILADLRRALTGESFVREHRVDQRWFESRGVPLHDAEGAVSSVLVVTFEITRRKNAEAVLREAVVLDEFRLRLSEALRSVGEPTEIQRAACRVLGEHLDVNRVLYSEMIDDEAIVLRGGYTNGLPPISTRRSTQTFGPRLVEAFMRGATLAIDDVEHDPRVSDSSRAAFLAIGARAAAGSSLAKDGHLIALFGVHSVVPRRWTPLEIRLIEETAQRTWSAVEQVRAESAAREERERRERLEREFIANASHELRTPLTGIMGAIEALEAGAKDDTEPRERFFGHLKREARRLAALTDSLLLLAQAGSAADLPYETVAVDVLITPIAAGLPVRDGVSVAMDVLKSLTLHTNPGLFQLVVGNLAGNAAKYTERGTITLKAYRRGSVIVVEVADTGTGMAPDTVERAFDRFYRGGSRSADGFGLGLSITQQAAAALGAELELDSVPGAGTTARLILPARRLRRSRSRKPTTPAVPQ